MQFTISVTETLSCLDLVDADTKEQAIDIVAERWKNGDVILDADDFQGVEFQIEEAN